MVDKAILGAKSLILGLSMVSLYLQYLARPPWHWFRPFVATVGPPEPPGSKLHPSKLPLAVIDWFLAWAVPNTPPIQTPSRSYDG